MDSTEIEGSGRGSVGTAGFRGEIAREPVVVPLAGLAGSGEAKLVIEPAALTEMAAACARFADEITGIRAALAPAGDAGLDWGLGDTHPRLTTAKSVVAQLRGYASAPDGALAVLDKHQLVVQEIGAMFTAMRSAYEHTDDQFAASMSLGPAS